MGGGEPRFWAFVVQVAPVTQADVCGNVIGVGSDGPTATCNQDSEASTSSQGPFHAFLIDIAPVDRGDRLRQRGERARRRHRGGVRYRHWYAERTGQRLRPAARRAGDRAGHLRETGAPPCSRAMPLAACDDIAVNDDDTDDATDPAGVAIDPQTNVILCGNGVGVVSDDLRAVRCSGHRGARAR